MKIKQKTPEYIQIEQLILGRLENEGYTLVDIVVSMKKIPSVTLYIWGDSGMDIDSLGSFSKKIHELLETIDFLADGFFLEVSSPGIYRKIKYADEFEVFLQRNIKIITKEGEKLTGILADYLPAESITLSCNDMKKTISIADISKASLNG